ncbi:MAG: helix-turn-helix domain-containing protein [Ekhidna sp.]|nr:helix-turn-helix domain-containing protein [Ekhidna sp.]
MFELVPFDHNEKSSILLIFFFHAIIFAALILKNSIEENRRASHWLALFLLLGALYLCPFMLGYAGWYGRDPYRAFMFFVPFNQLFLIGPVFFFYVQTLLDKQLVYTKRDLLHFAPAIVYLIYSLVVFVTDILLLDAYYFYADEQDKDLDQWYQIAGVISMLAYLLLSLRYYQSYRKISLQEVSFADAIAFKWIRNFAVAFSIILFLRIVFFFTNTDFWNFGDKFWYYLVFSLLLLYISISGYSQTIKGSIKVYLSPIKEPDQIEYKREKPMDGIPEKSAKEWRTKIIRMFEEEHIYKDPNLTLTDLAKRLHSNRSIISKVINQEFQLNFNDFVNERRAQAVMEKLKNGDHVKHTLLGIALDCGFNSKTTFNRAFKKHTGLTPHQFMENNVK